jgi:ATP-binding cassette subfamily F protein 3
MAMLTVEDLSKYWGVELLFTNIRFLLNEGEKMALVGRNGTGKTTLLKVLMGSMEYDGGTIQIPNGTRIGYVSQDPEFTPGLTLLEEAQSVFAYLAKWERDLRILEDKMGETTSEEALTAIMTDYARVTAQFEAAGGYGTPTRVKTVLFGLGFTDGDLQKPVDVLSGGQKVRLGLGKLLLEEPDLMLLDEPTNHLDLDATEWLEGYFRTMKSAAILVSHDRYFLDKVITRTLEMRNHSAEMFHGNYSYYLEEKKRRVEAAEDAFMRQQKEIARLQFFINKFRAGTRSTQAKSREKQIDRIELVERPDSPQRAMKLSFAMDYESGADVLKVESLAKTYGERAIFAGVNLEVFKGDRIALVGPNGAGKTTFLKIAHGLAQQTAGALRWGVGVQRGYFSQDLDALDYSRTAMEEMLEIPGFTKFEAHSLLGRFLFSGDDAYKPIAQCSGGERNRLILAKLMVSGANVLLLDEPTNHLDLESKMVLEEALSEFPGTVLFVSHDRYFVDQIAMKVWEFGRSGVTQYEGNYSAYKAEKERLALMTAETAQRSNDSPTKGAQGSGGRAPEPSAQASRARSKEERKAADTLRKLEEEIQQLEERKGELEGRMSDPDIYKSATGRIAVAEYNAIQSDLDRLYLEWERASN